MIASLLLRVRRFTQLVLLAAPSARERTEFGIVLGAIAAVGAWSRINLGYHAADVTVIFPVLSGAAMGWQSGVWTALLAAVVPMRDGEWLSLPIGLAAAMGASVARRLLKDPKSVWQISPIPFGNVSHAIRLWRSERKVDSRIVMLVAIAGAEIVRTEVARVAGNDLLFSFQPTDPLSYLAVVIACITSVAISLRIWLTPQMEARLRHQDVLLAEARFTALRSQINPHFLFNTLNTIQSLIRTHPDRARMVVIKLSAILRRLLYSSDDLISLKTELRFVDDYLGIEQLRFGDERLQIRKDIAEDALAVNVPAMLLQPLVENAIKHGVSHRMRGGVVIVGARVVGRMLHLTVEDNGRGMSRGQAQNSLRRGIGLTNIRERLNALYGDDFVMELDSQPGRGTLVNVQIPTQLDPSAQRKHGDGKQKRYIHERRTGTRHVGGDVQQ